MGQCQTAQLGVVEYDEAAVVHFPAGLPAFENETRFLLIEQDETRPVVFLQSLATPGLLFLTLPAGIVDPGYRLELGADERALLELAGDGPWAEGEDLVSLAILTVRPGNVVTANLLAPVVIGARSRRALQVVQAESGYRLDFPVSGGAVPACL